MTPAPTVLLAILSPTTLAVVAIVALLLFGGSRRIPDLMRSLGRSVTEFKKGLSDSQDADEEEAEQKKID